jgi:hypothetical protein
MFILNRYHGGTGYFYQTNKNGIPLLNYTQIIKIYHIKMFELMETLNLNQNLMFDHIQLQQ